MLPYVEMAEMLRKQPKGIIEVSVSTYILDGTLALGVTKCKEKESGKGVTVWKLVLWSTYVHVVGKWCNET